MLPVSLCWLCSVIEEDAVGQQAELIDLSAHWNWGVETTQAPFRQPHPEGQGALFLERIHWTGSTRVGKEHP